MTLPSFTDRIYLGPAVDSPGEKDVLILTKRPLLPCLPAKQQVAFYVTNTASIGGESKPCDVVVWNPYPHASPSDLPLPAFSSFVCVEPGLVANMHTLVPRARAVISQKIVPI